MRLTVGKDGELVRRDGTVVGRITSMTIELTEVGERAGRGTIGGGVEGGTTSGDSQFLQAQPDNSEEGGSGETSQESLLPDPINETWELYVTAVDRPKMQLRPKYRKWIADAHKAVGVDMTRQAIRGLAGSEYHREHGYIGLEYAIVPKRGESIEGRVEMMAAKAGALPASNGVLTVDQLVERFPAENRDRIRHECIAPINAMLRSPDDADLKLNGQRQLRRMRDWGFDIVIENATVTGAKVVN